MYKNIIYALTHILSQPDSSQGENPSAYTVWTGADSN